MFFSVTFIIATLFVPDVHSQVGSALNQAPTVKPTVKKKLPKALVIYERKDLQEGFVIFIFFSAFGVSFYETIKSIRIRVFSHN